MRMGRGHFSGGVQRFESPSGPGGPCYKGRMTITFDKLAFVRRLEGAKVPREQAEAMSEAFHDAVAEAVATKADVVMVGTEVTALRTDMKAEITALRTEMKTEFAAVRSDMKTEFAAVNAEFAAVRSEMKADAAALRSEIASLGLSQKLWTISMAAATLVALFGMFRFFIK